MTRELDRPSSIFFIFFRTDSVFNMSRIWKLYGTLACKGDNITHHPHRRSYLDIRNVKPVDLYAYLDQIIPMEKIPKLNPSPEFSVQKKNTTRSEGDFLDGFPLLDVASFLNAWDGDWRIKEKSTVTWYQFRICPIHRDYDGDEWECGICQFPSGKMGAKCMHDPTYNWQDFKAVLGDTRQFYIPSSIEI